MPDRDEAYRLLSLSLAMRWVIQKSELAMYFIPRWLDSAFDGVLASVMFVAAIVALAVFARDPHVAGIVENRWLLWLPLPFVVIPVLFRIAEIAVASTFGIQLGLLAPFVQINLNKIPPTGGHLQTLRVRSPGLAHSAVHQSEEIVGRIRQWLGLPSRKR